MNFQVTQVGSGAIYEIDSEKTFKIQPSASIKIILPNQILGVTTSDNLGVVQLVDLQGNPIVASKNIPVKILSSDDAVLRITDLPTIQKGYSYAYFDIETLEKIGTSTLTASAKGIIPSSLEIKTLPSASTLVVSVGNLPESLKIDEPYEITVYVDDSNQNSIDGARVKASSNDMIKFENNEIRTGNDGSAKLNVTASEGTQINISLEASKDNYIDAVKTVTLDVSSGTTKDSMSLSDFEFAPWMIYVAVAAIAVVGIFVMLFFRKRKEIEEWPEEDEI
jgi:hypothetical protein